jgi:hypothetical protein
MRTPSTIDRNGRVVPSLNIVGGDSERTPECEEISARRKGGARQGYQVDMNGTHANKIIIYIYIDSFLII